MRRSLLLAVLLLAAALHASALHAQVIAIYGTFSPIHLSNIETGAVYTATAPGGYTEATASYLSFGFGGGVTFNFLPVGPLRVGLDLRGSTKPGTQGADSALAGIKLGLHLPLLHLKPYVQASIGYLDTRTVNLSTTCCASTVTPIGGTFTNKYLGYEFMGGIDYPILGPLDVRIVEIGVGGGAGFDNYNATVVTVNSGLVLHF